MKITIEINFRTLGKRNYEKMNCNLCGTYVDNLFHKSKDWSIFCYDCMENFTDVEKEELFNIKTNTFMELFPTENERPLTDEEKKEIENLFSVKKK